MIPRPLLKLLCGTIAFVIVWIAGNSSGADPNLTLVVAAAAGFGTIYLSAKVGF